MKQLKPVLVKELYQIFYSPIAWIFTLLFILLNNFFYFSNLFLVDQAEMRAYFINLPLILIFFISFLTMGIFANERKSGTLEVILSLPLKKSTIVLAKFLALLLFFIFVMFFSLTIPITLLIIGKPDMGMILTGYLGTILLGGFYIAFGVFISSLFREQLLIALLTNVSLLIIFFSGQEVILERVPFILQLILAFLSPASHFINFSKGLISLGDIFYFLTLVGFFIWLTIKKLSFKNEI